MLEAHAVNLDEEVRRGLLLAFPQMQFIDEGLRRLPTRVKSEIAYIIGLGEGDAERRNIQRFYDRFLYENPKERIDYNGTSSFRSQLQGLPTRFARFNGDRTIHF